MPTIRELILRICASLIKIPVRSGIAKNIDTSANTCEVDLGNGASLYNVQLQSITNNGSKGVILYPVDGSVVQCSMIEGLDAQWFISNTCQVDSWAVYTTGGKLEVLKNGIVQLNGNTVGGNDSPLVEINGLLKRINNLETKMSSHQHAYVTPGGPAVTTPDPADSQGITPQTVISDIANNKVKQGDGN
jgi:hypothetical protein